MRVKEWITLFMFLAIVASAKSQVEVGPQPADGDAQSSTTIAALAFDEDSPPANDDDTQPPPTTVIPQSRLGFSISEPPPGSPSFVLLGLFLSEGAERQNTGNQGNSSEVSSATRISGTADLLKFWRRSVTALDYLGGDIVYGLHDNEQIQSLNVSHRFLGRRRELTLTDSVSNIPGGSFGEASFGGAGLYDLIFTGTGAGIQAGSGLANFFGSTGFGGIAEGHEVTNVALAELTQALTSRSVVTVAGGYGITDYYAQSQNLINNSQVSTLARYGYVLSPRSQIGVIYGYRSFEFPKVTEGQITTDLVQLVYERQLTHRMSLAFGAGPEFTKLRRRYGLSADGVSIHFYATTRQIDASAFALLAYRFRRATLTLSYDRLVTSGSGLVAGANSDIVVFGVGGPISRAWQCSVNAGYVHNSSLAENSLGVPSQSYQTGYAGIAFRRGFGTHFSLLASYQFSDLGYTPACAQLKVCGSTTQQQSGLIGLSWNFRPIRLE